MLCFEPFCWGGGKIHNFYQTFKGFCDSQKLNTDLVLSIIHQRNTSYNLSVLMASSLHLTPALMLSSSVCWLFLPWTKTILIASDGILPSLERYSINGPSTPFQYLRSTRSLYPNYSLLTSG